MKVSGGRDGGNRTPTRAFGELRSTINLRPYDFHYTRSLIIGNVDRVWNEQRDEHTRMVTSSRMNLPTHSFYARA